MSQSVFLKEAGHQAAAMRLDNFDEIAKNILNQGGVVALPKFAVPGTCWQGYFIDTEGNTFGIFQVDTTAR